MRCDCCLETIALTLSVYIMQMQCGNRDNVLQIDGFAMSLVINKSNRVMGKYLCEMKTWIFMLKKSSSMVTRFMARVAKFPLSHLILVCLLLVWITGCATAFRGNDYLRTELYFGQIGKDDWEDFLAREVTPRFPEGLTVVDGAGQWRNPAGQIEKEHARVLILIHGLSLGEDEKIEELRRLYCKKFHQQSVLRVDEKVKASF